MANAPPPRWELRFPRRDLRHWAERYDGAEDVAVLAVAEQAMQRGYLDRAGFLTLCAWKTTRTKSRCAANRDAEIAEATRIALSADCDRTQMAVLRGLDGVEWPTASVILHLCRRDRHPLLDFRALWSLSVPQPSAYTLAFWRGYIQATRQLAGEAGLDMRTLDRALWQYSKENQRD